jgi:hypothetical protein
MRLKKLKLSSLANKTFCIVVKSKQIPILYWMFRSKKKKNMRLSFNSVILYNSQ